jgi:hypothetical protein
MADTPKLTVGLSDLLAHLTSVVVVGPNAHVVFTFAHNLSPAEFAQIRKTVDERCPGIADRILFVGSDPKVTVLQGEETEETQ